MAFGTRLRELREARNLTQDQLAKAAGMSKGSIANLEQGFRKTPNWETLQKLAAALGVEMDAFAEPTKEMPPRGRGRPPKADPATEKPVKSKRKKDQK